MMSIPRARLTRIGPRETSLAKEIALVALEHFSDRLQYASFADQFARVGTCVSPAGWRGAIGGIVIAAMGWSVLT